MRPIAGLILVAVFMVAGSGCAAMRHGSPAATSTVAGAQTAEDTDRLFGERLNAGDVEGLVALYEPNATLVRQDGTPAIGTAAIRDEITAAVALRPQIVMSVKRVLTGGDDVAVIYNDWHAVGTNRDGKHVALSGHASEVVRRQPDGTWLFAVDDPNARSIPAAAHPHHATEKHARKGARKTKHP